MAVEKMEMLSAVGCLKDIKKVTDEMVKCGCIHIINSVEDIGNYSGDDYVLNILKPLKTGSDYSDLKRMLSEIVDGLGMKKTIKKKYMDNEEDIKAIYQSVLPLYRECRKFTQTLERANDQIARMLEIKENLKNIMDVKFDISDLKGLEFFSFSMGKFRKENYIKLKDNIENIHAIIYEVNTTKNHIIIISFTPKSSVPGVQNIFRSLGYEEMSIPERARGVPSEIVKKLDELINERKEEISGITKEIQSLGEKSRDLVEWACSLLEKYEKGQIIDNKAVQSEQVFCISGWIPSSAKQGLIKELDSLKDEIVLVFRESEKVINMLPPTKLKNNGMFKPFEYIVNMYGIPSYGEIDPTIFMGITYMIMFGMMFGDVGQGFIILAGGLFLSKIKKMTDFGGIFFRIGLSSMIFGCFYGSIFGNEQIIKPLLFHPLDRINTVLLGGVILGLIFSTISYVFNFINSAREKELEEGLFGREGAAGFIFYYAALLFVLKSARFITLPIPNVLLGIIMAILLLVLVLKHPLSRLIEGKRPLYSESPADYYVESIFGVIETVLGMLSKTISFIRLGAFALNHVGLFIAFQTMARLVNNGAISIIILILANVLIISLEGLVVFIQGLRLEYYELFSRYYRGDGMEYDPVNLSYEEEFK